MVEADSIFEGSEQVLDIDELHRDEVDSESGETASDSLIHQSRSSVPHFAVATICGTVVVPLHNHAAFIRERLASLLSQWRPELELLLIDDGSVDAGYAIANSVLEAYPHVSVTLVREVSRTGHGLLATMLELGRGNYFIQADSDDVALPGRLDIIADCFDGDPTCRLVTSNALLISPEGYPIAVYDPQSKSEVLTDPVDAAARQGDNRWLGATAAFHRDLLEAFPAIDPELCPYGLDLIASLRARLLGTHHYIAEPLVGWRQHATNTHRLNGAVETSDLIAIERRHANGIMALAQKMRDIAHRRDAMGGKGLDQVADAALATFTSAFDEWCRSRSRNRPAAPATASKPFVPEAPPVVTLKVNETRHLASFSQTAAVMARWSGFSVLEAWGIWTHRVALFVVRLSADVRMLRFEFSVHPWCDRQRVRIRVGEEEWERDDIAPNASMIAEIALRTPRSLIQPVVIIAHDASAPSPIESRSLGIALTSLSAL